MTASAFSLSALYPSSRFDIIEGRPVIGGLRGPTRHFFCPECLSWAFTRPEGFDEVVNVRATLLDDAGSFTPFIETYTCEKLPWATTPAAHSFERFPDPERFPELCAEFLGRSPGAAGGGAAAGR